MDTLTIPAPDEAEKRRMEDVENQSSRESDTSNQSCDVEAGSSPLGKAQLDAQGSGNGSAAKDRPKRPSVSILSLLSKPKPRRRISEL